MIEKGPIGFVVIIDKVEYSVSRCSTEIHPLTSNINGGIHPVSQVGLADHRSYPRWGMLTKLSPTLFLVQKVEVDIGVRETMLYDESSIIEGLMV